MITTDSTHYLLPLGPVLSINNYLPSSNYIALALYNSYPTSNNESGVRQESKYPINSINSCQQYNLSLHTSKYSTEYRNYSRFWIYNSWITKEHYSVYSVNRPLLLISTRSNRRGVSDMSGRMVTSQSNECNRMRRRIGYYTAIKLLSASLGLDIHI